MKFPKNRADLYLVERWDTYLNSSTVVVGAFSSPDEADDFKSACEQEWKDKGFYEDIERGHIVFNVALTTYYG